MATKFGMGAASLASYSACFSDDTIFPASKRVTAIGICNIVARALTILAPLVNEARVPLPMLSFIAAISIALIFSFSFRQEGFYNETVSKAKFLKQHKDDVRKNF
jgi:hypothetical protein